METPRAQSPTTWTVLSLLAWTTKYLEDRGFDESRLHCELMLAHVLRISRLDLYLQFDRPLVPEELTAFKALLQRRVTHEPLQYILGTTEFMGMTFTVDPRVLIPRPETEHLVEAVVAHCRAAGKSEPRILDAGTGSGNIALAIGHLIPGATISALDCSEPALDVARMNAAKTGVHNVTFTRIDLLAEDPPGLPLDVIASNPPYIAAGEMSGLAPEVREFEPSAALTDGADGLTFHRRLAELARRFLVSGGGLYVEIGAGQADDVTGILSGSGLSDITIQRDYAGHLRVASARQP